MREEWKPIWHGVYELSARGIVRRVKPGRGALVGRILKWHLDGCGYPQVCLTLGRRSEGRWRKVHTLVAAEFIGPRPKGKEVNHKDGNKTNNYWRNLEYLTHLDNVRHSEALGLRRPKRGEEHGMAKITWRDVAKIRKLWKTGKFTKSSLARKLEIDRWIVSTVVLERNWKAA